MKTFHSIFDLMSDFTLAVGITMMVVTLCLVHYL